MSTADKKLLLAKRKIQFEGLDAKPHQEKKKRYINRAIYCINRGGISLFTSKSYLPLMANTLISPLMMFSVATVLLSFLLIGDWLVWSM